MVEISRGLHSASGTSLSEQSRCGLYAFNNGAQNMGGFCGFCRDFETFKFRAERVAVTWGWCTAMEGF